MTVEEKYSYDKQLEASKAYRTLEEVHPGVKEVYQQGNILLGGRVRVVALQNQAFTQYRYTPTQSRKIFAERGWKRVVSFQKPTTGPSSAPCFGENRMTTIWYEILPIMLESNHVVILRRRADSETSSWLVLHQPGICPNDAVLEHLVGFFGEVFDPQKSIVHSTSWRYDYQVERLILTYLVVLPQQMRTNLLAATQRISIQYVRAIEKVYGDNLRPPARIEVENVLAHALDHLALLSRYDRSIQSLLQSEWLDLLRRRLPKPAGYCPSIL
jgi:hypothetical protein